MKIAIASGKGGVGKSMLSSVLAMLFAQTGKKVLAIDCDVDAPNLNLWLGGKKPQSYLPIHTIQEPQIDHTLCRLCGTCIATCRFGALTKIENAQGKQQIQVIAHQCEGCGACVLFCPHQAIHLTPVVNAYTYSIAVENNITLLGAQLVPGKHGSGEIISFLKKEAEKEMADIVLLDSSAGIGCPVIASLQGVDYVILVVEPMQSSFQDMQRVLEVVRHFKIDYGFVINKHDINVNMTKTLLTYAGERLLGKIRYNKGIFQAIANLLPILKTDLPTVQEIEVIFNELNRTV